jgi:hypothetical protein
MKHLKRSLFSVFNYRVSNFKTKKTMKKLFFPAVVIVAMTLASCAKQDVIGDVETSNGSLTPINFGTFVGKSAGVNTKADVANISTLQTNGFIVQAYGTGQANWTTYTDATDKNPTFMSDQDVTYNSSWEYTPVRYWPANQSKVTFFAYSPNNNDVSYNPSFSAGSVTAKLDFTTQSQVEDQLDLLAATAYDQYGRATSNQVSLAFDHLLTKIGFTAKLSSALPLNTTLTVTKVELNILDGKIDSKGTFTFANPFANSTWGSLSDKFTSAATDVLDNGNLQLTVSAQQLHTADKFAMLIPQTLEKAFTITITYKVKDEQANETVYTIAPVSLPASQLALEKGKQYTFNFSFTLYEVVFDGITANDWADATPPSVDTDI